jgi:hypothetical protein
VQGWVDRGDVVEGFATAWIFSSAHFPIRSPTNGFVLGVTDSGYGEMNDWTRPKPTTLSNNSFMMLVARDENVPDSDESCFGEMLEQVSEHRQKLFSDSYLRDHLKTWIQDGTLDRFLETQLAGRLAARFLSRGWFSTLSATRTCTAELPRPLFGIDTCKIPQGQTRVLRLSLSSPLRHLPLPVVEGEAMENVSRTNRRLHGAGRAL